MQNIRRVVLGVIRSCSEQAANLGVGEPTTQPLLDTIHASWNALHTLLNEGSVSRSRLSGFQIQPNVIFIVAVGESLESAIVMLHSARTGKPG